jgi:hypothetical protein
MAVVADKVKFLDALKVDEGIFRSGGKTLLKAIFAGIIVIVAWLFLGRVGLIISVVVAGGYFILNNYNEKRPLGSKSINTALGVLGETVADVVFLPLIGMAICDRPMNDSELDYIQEEMRYWGYSDEFIGQFIQRNCRKHIDSIRLAAADIHLILRKKSQLEKGQGRIILKDINEAALRRKAYEICKRLYNDLNNGLPDPASERYLSELEVRLKLKGLNV